MIFFVTTGHGYPTPPHPPTIRRVQGPGCLVEQVIGLIQALKCAEQEVLKKSVQKS